MHVEQQGQQEAAGDVDSVKTFDPQTETGTHTLIPAISTATATITTDTWSASLATGLEYHLDNLV